jgi:hypothetical protein
MAILAFALPILPGARERLMRTAQELAERRDEYEALNQAAGLRRHVEFLERSPVGDLHIVVYETDDPSRLSRTFSDSEYDRWWVARLKDLYGVDASTGPPPSPDVTQIWSWERNEP